MLAPQGTGPAPQPRIWPVGALCRAIADALEARFNPVAVRGEVSGFVRAGSGHWYFSLKDAQGQIRCAMFRRAASLLDFVPRDGELVEVQGRLGVYEPRGELQLVVETMRRAGQGALFEQFLRLKARLEAEGLFDASRKRMPPSLPRAIGLVTSLGAAALHDTVTCLRRRAPHVRVVLVPASVQGSQAPAEIVGALQSLDRLASREQLDAILLVRGGGSIEDLWAFNDERVARAIVASSVPVIAGIGHETDFTIADFCADVRAPTPTAAAELVARPRADWLEELALQEAAFTAALRRRVDRGGERVDRVAARLGRPLARVSDARVQLARLAHRLQHASQWRTQAARSAVELLGRRWHAGLSDILRDADLAHADLRSRWESAVVNRLTAERQTLDRHALRLRLLDPRLVLERGYALLTDAEGHVVTSARALAPGQSVHAALADGEVDLTVARTAVNRP